LNFDATFKSIPESLANAVTPALTGAKPVAHLNSELRSPGNRMPDYVTSLDDGRIFHLEVQSRNEPRMPQRMLQYWLMLHERFKDQRILQHCLYIGKPACSMASRLENEILSYRYQLTDIREIDEDVFMDSNSDADRALAVLTKMKDERATVRRILGSWLKNSKREQEDLREKLMILSGLRKLEAVVQQEVKRMPIEIDLLENSVIRGYWEDGIERGMERGMAKGMASGQSDLLMKQMTKRFGTLSSDLQAKIHAAHAPELERWALRFVDAASLEDIFSN